MNTKFYLNMGAAMLAGFGAMFIIIALAYTRDLASITRMPGMVWQYVCGVPINGNPAIPLIVIIGMGCLLCAGGMWWWSRRRTA